jgi:hypothetical protein
MANDIGSNFWHLGPLDSFNIQPQHPEHKNGVQVPSQREHLHDLRTRVIKDAPESELAIKIPRLPDSALEHLHDLRIRVIKNTPESELEIKIPRLPNSDFNYKIRQIKYDFLTSEEKEKETEEYRVAAENKDGEAIHPGEIVKLAEFSAHMKTRGGPCLTDANMKMAKDDLAYGDATIEEVRKRTSNLDDLEEIEAEYARVVDDGGPRMPPRKMGTLRFQIIQKKFPLEVLLSEVPHHKDVAELVALHQIIASEARINDELKLIDPADDYEAKVEAIRDKDLRTIFYKLE